MTTGRSFGNKEKGKALPARALTVKQERVIIAVLGSRTIREACRASGITTSTYYLWLKQPDFARALRGRREALITRAMDRLEGGLAFALGRLVDLVPLRIKESKGLKGRVTVLERSASRNRPEEA